MLHRRQQQVWLTIGEQIVFDVPHAGRKRLSILPESRGIDYNR